jgi:hypothetical protein
MRKMLWGAAAVVVVALGVGYQVLEYAHDHPTSWFGRCLVGARHAAASEAHAIRSAERTTEVGLRAVTGLLGAGGEGGDPCDAHAAPAADEGCEAEPAVLPGGVVIHEEDGLPAEPMPPVHDVVGVLPFLGAEDSEDVPMPRVPDDAPKMPPVPGDDGPREPRPGTMPRCDRDAAGSLGAWFFGVPRAGSDPPRPPRVNTLEIRPSDVRSLDPRVPF